MESPEISSQTYDVSRKASLLKRFLALLIDGILAGVISALLGIVGTIAGAAYLLVRDGLDLGFMDLRSIGKKIMKLRQKSKQKVPKRKELLYSLSL